MTHSATSSYGRLKPLSRGLTSCNERVQTKAMPAAPAMLTIGNFSRAKLQVVLEVLSDAPELVNKVDAVTVAGAEAFS
jgi:hypothetical protein